MKYISQRPSRLYCPTCEEVYPVPQVHPLDPLLPLQMTVPHLSLSLLQRLLVLCVTQGSDRLLLLSFAGCCCGLKPPYQCTTYPRGDQIRFNPLVHSYTLKRVSCTMPHVLREYHMYSQLPLVVVQEDGQLACGAGCSNQAIQGAGVPPR